MGKRFCCSPGYCVDFHTGPPPDLLLSSGGFPARDITYYWGSGLARIWWLLMTPVPIMGWWSEMRRYIGTFLLWNSFFMTEMEGRGEWLNACCQLVVSVLNTQRLTHDNLINYKVMLSVKILLPWLVSLGHQDVVEWPSEDVENHSL